MLAEVKTIERSVLDHFSEKNRAYWRVFTDAISVDPGKAILVDFMVDHPAYLIGNGVLAKYLQKSLGVRVYAVVPGKEAQLALEMARSFCFDGTVEADTEIAMNARIDWQRLFGNMTIEQQRKKLLNFVVNDVVVGDLAYDTYLRNSGMGTVEDIDRDVLVSLSQTIRDYVFYENIARQLNVVASVQGHIVYSGFGSMARAVVNNGGEVFGRKYASGPGTVRRYRTLDELKNHEFVFSQNEFEEVFRGRREKAVRTAREYMDQRIRRISRTQDGAEAYAQDKKHYTRDELVDKLGIDPSLPMVVIMSHVFPDAPHSFAHNLYDDYVQWLRATLEMIRDMTHVNWLIKPHPDNKHYDSKHSVEEEARVYVAGRENINILPDDLNTACLYDFAHAVVTVAGTAGLEFSAMGIPVVNAGSSFYTGHGFTQMPATIEEYRAVLAGIDRLERLDNERQERALTCMYMYYFLSRVRCDLVPETPSAFWMDMDLNEVMAEAARLVDGFSHEADDLYRNFSIQLESGKDHLLDNHALT